MRKLLAFSLLCSLACAGGDKQDGADDDTAAPVDPALDVLVVLDTSDSMADLAYGIAVGMPEFTGALEAAGRTDWRIGITTTSANVDAGPTTGEDPGEAGTLLGGAWLTSADDVTEAMLCDGVAWNERELASDPSYACGDAAPATVSEEYLDCLCGVGAWNTASGSGLEQGLEAGLDAVCRSVASPSATCFDADVLTTDDAGTNPAFDGTTPLAIVVVSDEGDSSARLATGDVDGVTLYTDALTEMAPGVTFSAMGPAWDGTNGDCLDGAQTWGVERYQLAADTLGGVYLPITDAACGAVPAADLLSDLAGAI